MKSLAPKGHLRPTALGVLALALTLIGCISSPDRKNVTSDRPMPTSSSKLAVNHVLVVPVTSGDRALNDVIRAEAADVFRGNLVTSADLSRALDRYQAGRLPRGFTSLVGAGYQLEFALWLEAYHAGKARTARLAQPMLRLSGQASAPEHPRDVQAMLALIKGLDGEIAAVNRTLARGDYRELLARRGAERASLMVASKLSPRLLQDVRCSHILVTHVDHSSTSYDKGQPVRLSVALINVKTGEIEKFAERMAVKIHDVARRGGASNYGKTLTRMALDVFGSPTFQADGLDLKPSKRLVARSGR